MLHVRQDASLLVFVALGCCLGCCPSAQMTELPPRYDNHSPDGIAQVPVILVGRVLTDAVQVGGFHTSRFDEPTPTRLLRSRVKIENVLQGDVAQKDVDIFYFIESRSLGSSASYLYLPAGARRIFFLQRDDGKLRTIFDNWETCVEKVYSGAHPAFKRNPDRPVTEAITDLLLTKGEGATDKSMIEAVYEVGGHMGKFGGEVVIKRLQQVARQETLPVREEACYFLAEVNHPCEGISGKEQFRSEK